MTEMQRMLKLHVARNVSLNNKAYPRIFKHGQTKFSPVIPAAALPISVNYT